MYSTLEDLKKAAAERTIAQLTDDESGAAVQADIVDEAIVAADEVIDAHLRGRYELPLPETPAILKRLSVSITLFHLYSRRPEGEVPDAVTTQYKQSVRMLEGIRDGKLTIGESQGPAAPEGVVFKTNKKPEQKVFNNDSY